MAKLEPSGVVTMSCSGSQEADLGQAAQGEPASRAAVGSKPSAWSHAGSRSEVAWSSE